MSYCVHCGVKLSNYHTNCPLCNTKVYNPNTKEVSGNTDYPEYIIHHKKDRKRANKLFTAIILSLLSFIYTIIPVLINLIINKKLSWSLIVLISITLLWFGIAFPFFNKNNTFFKLFTYDCIAITVYLLLLNYIISSNFLWSRFTTLAIFIVWIIMSGIFITNQIKKIIPLTFYYLLNSIIITFIFAFIFYNEISILYVLISINTLIFILTLLSYFIVIAKVYDFLGFIIVLLVDISIFALSLNLILSKHIQGYFNLNWSIIIIVITIPLIATTFSIRKGKQIKSFISKKLHQ